LEENYQLHTSDGTAPGIDRKLGEPLSRSGHSLMELSLLEELSVVHLLKNFPAFYGTRRFITVFTRALHWSLS
jgi:hypothetical protein